MPSIWKKFSSWKVTPQGVLAVIVAGFAVVLLVNSVYLVDQTEDAVVLTFGQYNRTEGPGMHFKVPLVEVNFNVTTKAVQKMDFGFRQKGAELVPAEAVMLTGDLNIIQATWIVQYRITDPVQWLFGMDGQEKTIRDIGRAVVNQLVGDRAILDILGSERQSIEVLATETMNGLFAQYGLGVRVTGTQLKDIFPPAGTVRAAFDDVNVAFQDMNRLINEGREYYNREIPMAAGTAQQTVQVAEGYATERINKALGDTARFQAVLAEYNRNPTVTRNRLYLETMEQVLGQAGRSDLVDKKIESFLPFKNLGGRP